MNLRSAHATDVGLHRDNNEDAFLDLPGLWATADGMGGHHAGEVASRIAVDMLLETAVPLIRDGGDVSYVLKRVFEMAHVAVLAAGRQYEVLRRPGTTLTALGISNGKATIAHAGDSRCYLIRNGQGRQLTKDHSDGGCALSNCLGNRPESHVGTEITELAVEPGDTFVLCTDGLAEYADAAKVANLITAARFASRVLGDFSLEAIAKALVKHALRAGGRDNVTVVVVEVL